MFGAVHGVPAYVEPAYVDPQTKREEEDTILTTIVAMVRGGLNSSLPPIQHEGTLKQAVSQCTPNRQIGERALKNSKSDSRGFIEATRVLHHGVVNEFIAFCEDPVYQMVEGTDYERARGRFKTTIRALGHFMLTRQNDSGVIFRDKVLEMAQKFYQLCMDLLNFDQTAWEEGRAQSKEASKGLNKEKSNRLQSGYKKPTQKTVKRCNKRAQITGAECTRQSLSLLFDKPRGCRSYTQFAKEHTNNLNPGNITENLDADTNVVIAFAKLTERTALNGGSTDKEARQLANKRVQEFADIPGWSKNPLDHVQPHAKKLCIGPGDDTDIASGENPPRRSERNASSAEASIVRA